MTSSKSDAKLLPADNVARLSNHELTEKVLGAVQRQGLAQALRTPNASHLESFYLIALSRSVPDGAEMADARKEAALRLARREGDKHPGRVVRASGRQKASA
jgi:hypothetical protein